MKKYELTDRDISTLIGVAAACTMDQHPQKYPKLIGGLFVEFAAEISCAVLDHLSGKKTLPEDDIQFAKRADEELSRLFDSLA